MSHAVVRLPLGSGAFSVNAYLIRTEAGFVLVDTGMRSQRELIEEHLRSNGCGRDSLRLILLTHGDLDHIGNAAYLRSRFDAPVAMNLGDVGMSRDGEPFSGRNRPNVLVRAIMAIVARLPAEDRFEPDLALDEGSDLSEYGLTDARVLVVPGHSSGSVVLSLSDGSLICGDLLENRKTPKLGSIMDDVPAARLSVTRLLELQPVKVYPGHGTPFDFEDLPADVLESGPQGSGSR